MKLPFRLIDTGLLTSCCVIDQSDAPSVAYSQSVEQMMPAKLRAQHRTTDSWWEPYDIIVTDKAPWTHVSALGSDEPTYP